MSELVLQTVRRRVTRRLKHVTQIGHDATVRVEVGVSNGLVWTSRWSVLANPPVGTGFQTSSELGTNRNQTGLNRTELVTSLLHILSQTLLIPG